MKKTPLYFILVVILLSGCSLAGICQTHFSVSAGLGFFNLSDIKSLQIQQLGTFPVKAEITSSFPPHAVYGLSATRFMRNDLMLGLSTERGSTGGRIYYEDSSGKARLDHLLRYTSLGLNFGGWGKMRNDKFYYSVDLHPGVTLTSLTFRGFTSSGPYTGYEITTKVKGLNVSVQPTVACMLRLGRVGVSLFGGHHLTIVSGKLKLKENKDVYLDSKADWSGFRVGAGASIFVGNKAPTKDL